MSNEKIRFVYVTYIRSTPEAVFDAVTRPEVARHYWGHENVSDWQPGSRWQHVRDDAQRTVNIVGEVVEVSRPKRLVVTWASPSRVDDPEAYSRVTFEIDPYDDMVKLTVTHEDLEPDSAMAKGVTKGWPIVIASLKSLLETGEGIDVFAKPKVAASAA